tara:strand:- start:5 stop:439 length:435 start_codon:yes stop_codon:yes gene_type:complete
MPSYPAKPYLIPHDDWFNNNSSNFENKSRTKGTKKISTIHEFFYRQSDVKAGGSENHIQTDLEQKLSQDKIISSLRNTEESFLLTVEEKYSYSKIPVELKSIKKRSFQRKKVYKNLSNKNTFKFRSYLLNLKTVFLKIIGKKRS